MNTYAPWFGLPGVAAGNAGEPGWRRFRRGRRQDPEFKGHELAKAGPSHQPNAVLRAVRKSSWAWDRWVAGFGAHRKTGDQAGAQWEAACRQGPGSAAHPTGAAPEAGGLAAPQPFRQVLDPPGGPAGVLQEELLGRQFRQAGPQLLSAATTRAEPTPRSAVADSSTDTPAPAGPPAPGQVLVSLCLERGAAQGVVVAGVPGR